MTNTYAANTTVPSERSRTEIERTLRRFGADSFFYGWEGNEAVIQFRAHGKSIRFMLPLPEKDSREFTHTPSRGTPRTERAAEQEWEKATRQQWRALALIVKAKLAAVDSGITEFESEFLAHIVLPDGQTVGEFVLPQVELAYELGEMPSALPMSRDTEAAEVIE